MKFDQMKRWWLAGLACASMGNALAEVDNGANGGELLLYIWDDVAKVSYTKDLGITMDAFFVAGQQDAGGQQFWQLAGANDAPFSAFRSASTAANTKWALFGIDSAYTAADQAGGLIENGPGASRLFMTLRNTTTTGVIGGAYESLTKLDNIDFWTYAGNMAGLLPDLNDVRPNSTHMIADWQQDGSSFDVEGTPQYFDKQNGILADLGGASKGIFPTNKLGESSWFYYVTASSDYENFDKVIVDEFDNLGHDAYWGLAVDPTTNNYVLSYTLAAYSQSAMSFSPIGTARAAVTEYLASTGDRLLDTPDGAYVGYVPIDLSPTAPVPEPAAWLLFGGGALALIARRRARKTSR